MTSGQGGLGREPSPHDLVDVMYSCPLKGGQRHNGPIIHFFLPVCLPVYFMHGSPSIRDGGRHVRRAEEMERCMLVGRPAA